MAVNVKRAGVSAGAVNDITASIPTHTHSPIGLWYYSQGEGIDILITNAALQAMADRGGIDDNHNLTATLRRGRPAVMVIDCDITMQQFHDGTALLLWAECNTSTKDAVHTHTSEYDRLVTKPKSKVVLPIAQ